MAQIFKFLALALIAAVAGAGVTILFHWGTAPAMSATVDDITYADFLSITLTALGVMITILGFFVAAAGVLGWTTLENKLKSHSVDYFKEQLKENAKLRREFEELIVKVAHSGIESFKAQKGIEDNSELPGNDGDNSSIDQEYHD